MTCVHEWVDDWHDSGFIHQHCGKRCGNYRYIPESHEAEPLEAALDPFGDDEGVEFANPEPHVTEEER